MTKSDWCVEVQNYAITIRTIFVVITNISTIVEIRSTINHYYQHPDKIRLVSISPELPLLKLWQPLQEACNKGGI